ncbi:hypothetical protein DFH06DRAFT_1151369 [Mycena polygramma]|nr:hypothetical protein DFH06DRAFT_1151369 [Mycena polygramma]
MAAAVRRASAPLALSFEIGGYCAILRTKGIFEDAADASAAKPGMKKSPTVADSADAMAGACSMHPGRNEDLLRELQPYHRQTAEACATRRDTAANDGAEGKWKRLLLRFSARVELGLNPRTRAERSSGEAQVQCSGKDRLAAPYSVDSSVALPAMLPVQENLKGHTHGDVFATRKSGWASADVVGADNCGEVAKLRQTRLPATSVRSVVEAGAGKPMKRALELAAHESRIAPVGQQSGGGNVADATADKPVASSTHYREPHTWMISSKDFIPSQMKETGFVELLAAGGKQAVCTMFNAELGEAGDVYRRWNLGSMGRK